MSYHLPAAGSIACCLHELLLIQSSKPNMEQLRTKETENFSRVAPHTMWCATWMLLIIWIHPFVSF